MRSKSLRNDMLGYRKTVTIETTLYDLIDAVREEIRSNEDYLLVHIVSRLAASGRLKFRSVPKEFNAVHPHTQEGQMVPAQNQQWLDSVVQK